MTKLRVPRRASRRARRGFGAAAAAATLGCAGVGALTYALLTAPTPPPPPTKAQAGTLIASAPVSAPRAQPQSSAHPGLMTLGSSKPVSLSIPSIGLKAAVDQLGLNADGTVQVPGRPMDAGWYTGSSSPGEAGASVILGHVDFHDSGPAVFYRLGSLLPGATATVARQDGTTATFTVTAVREFPKSDFPTAEVYGATGDTAQLRLITCGSWDSHRHAYTGNTVAFASLTAVTRPAAASPAAGSRPQPSASAYAR
jgi:Sortase domain